MHIQSNDIILTFLESKPAYEIQSCVYPETYFSSKVGITLDVHGKEHGLFQSPFQIVKKEKDIKIETRFGELVVHRVTYTTDLEGVQVALQIGVCPAKTMAVLKADIRNNSQEDITLKRISLVDINPGDLHLGEKASPTPCFYSSGWQSWSCTASYALGDKQRTSILGRFQNPMVVNPGTPQPRCKNHFTGDMFGVLGDRASRTALLGGFLSQKEQYGSLEAVFTPEPALKMWANSDDTIIRPDASIQTDWAVLSFTHLDSPEPMRAYLEAVAEENKIQSTAPVPIGWCSWYHFYQDISEEAIEANLHSVVKLTPELPLPLLQIDDGFEPYAGDWFDFVPEFPHGLKPLVEKTTAAGLTPGLWLAPFIVHPKAKLVSEHPDWLLRDERGKPVNAGFVWNAFTYALDLTHPEALAYTCDVIRTAVKKWGFSYLKLDFLYAAALPGKYQDPTLTRAQVLRQGLESIRKAAGPDVTLLACGCPFGSALGLFEAMRISADVSGSWKPHFPPVSPILQNEPHMPAVRNALQNILTRAPLHRHWWINDPDCLLVRPDTHLTLAEVRTLATAIGMTGGSLLLSDDLPELPEDRLRLAQILLPVIDRRARVLDLFDAVTPARLRLDLDGTTGSWHLLAWFNWKDQPDTLAFSPQAFRLDGSKAWWLREFWTGSIGQMRTDSPLTFQAVPAHGVRVAAVRAYDAARAAYLGSDLHLSQGLEISQWEQGEKSLKIGFSLGRQASGRMYLYLPWQPKEARMGETSRKMKEEGGGIYVVDIEDANGKTLTIRG